MLVSSARSNDACPFRWSVVRGKLYLFGGASSPDATECLPGVYSFDIGEDVLEGKRITTSFRLVLKLLLSLLPFCNSVSDLGSLRSRGRGPPNPQTQLRLCGRQHLRVRRHSGRESHQWPHGLQHRSIHHHHCLDLRTTLLLLPFISFLDWLTNQFQYWQTYKDKCVCACCCSVSVSLTWTPVKTSGSLPPAL